MVGASDLAMTRQVGHLVTLEQHLDASRQSGDSFTLLSHHLLQVKTDLASDNTSVGQVTMLGHVVIVRVIEESFAGNTSDIETSSSKRGILLHTNSLHAQLSSLDGSNISSRSRSNHHQINIVMCRIVTGLVNINVYFENIALLKHSPE